MAAAAALEEAADALGGGAGAKPEYRKQVQIGEAVPVPVSLKDAKHYAVMPAPASGPPKTWGQMQLEDKFQPRGPADMAAVGAGPRLGVPLPKPGGSFPLGIKSDVPTLGTNVAKMYRPDMKYHSNQKFTRSFNPDFFVL